MSSLDYDNVVSGSDSDNNHLGSSLVLRETFGDSASQNNPIFIPELSNMIIETLGERTIGSPIYLNKKSLANLAATCRYFAATIEPFLYALDIKDRQLKGLKYASRRPDDLAVSILSKYPEELVKSCIDRELDVPIPQDYPQNLEDPQGLQVQVEESGSYTLLHLAAFHNMHHTIIKLHQLGAQWRYCRNVRALLSHEERANFATAFPAFQSMFRNVSWAPNLASLLKKDEDTCELLAKYWPESYPFVGKFIHPNGRLPGSRVDEYTLTLVHLYLLRVPSNDMSRLVTETLKNYPKLFDFPATEHQYSIYHLAVRVQNRTFLSNAWSGVNDGVPYFVDNRGYNPLHIAIIESLKGTTGRNPRSQDEAGQVLQFLLDRRMNPMMPQTKAPYKTPLLMVAKIAILDWTGQNNAIKKNIEAIASAEKRLAAAWGFEPTVFSMNRFDSNGNTVLRYIAKAIVNYHTAGGSRPLENLFVKLITNFGADINLDVNFAPTPYDRPYVHSIKWIADHSTKRNRFKKLVNDFGGRLHAAEVARTYAPTTATVDFPVDELHLPYLPHNHPYILSSPFNRAFIRRSPSEEARS
ncbi:hypothetical protein FPOAC2_11033 [Fusarium poae]|uniref:Ankyrin repeat protein n=2 Tax=Fusarium poae TaxID=36050 RepID=A0A1B8ACN8_FUSPO|nr:hypothetical protein FPOA_09964 [Fusarium poae]